MVQYIDKSAVVAEIEDWRDKIKKGIFSIPLCGNERAYATFEYEVLGKVMSFLDTFEVKEETEWNEASIKPPFIRTEDGNKYSEPLLCRDKFGNYFIANYVRWRTGYYGWFSGNDEISITHWKELQ